MGLYSSKLFCFFLSVCFFKYTDKIKWFLKESEAKAFFQVMMMSLVKFTPCVQCAGSACGNMREVCLGV